MPNLVKGFRYLKKKTPLTSSENWHQIICQFCVLLRTADAHMNNRAGSLTDYK